MSKTMTINSYNLQQKRIYANQSYVLLTLSKAPFSKLTDPKAR